MAKRQNFVIGSTNPNTEQQTVTELNNAWDMFTVLRSGKLDGVFNAVSDYSNDSSNEIANAILSITGSEPVGNSQDELAGALAQMRSEIETTSLTFKGYVGTSAPSSTDYVLIEGNIWINSAAMPTSFPIAASDIKQWDGSAWVNYGSTYTPADFDFFRNTEDNEGYYWFGGQWTIMSTDMSTTYFVLNQNTGKWEIKSSVNLPGNPTTTTPAAGDNSTKIATTAFVASNSYHPNLFDVKWADHELDDTSWLRADTFSWQSGAVYQPAYKHLMNDMTSTSGGYCEWRANEQASKYTKKVYPDVGDAVFSNGALTNQIGTVESVDFSTLGSPQITVNSVDYTMSFWYGTTQTETVENTTVQFYLAEDGHKICLPSQESNVAAIYAATGVAWYYIIDWANQQFKLPRTKFGFNGLRDTVGKYVAPGVPNITGEIQIERASNNNTATGAFYISDNTTLSDRSAGTSTQKLAGIDASRSSSIYGSSNTVQSPATQMYLYFYVGAFSQTALENTAGLNAELFNNKVDVGHQVVSFQKPTAQNNYTWYRLYADGWVEQGIRSDSFRAASSSTTVQAHGSVEITNAFSLPIPMSVIAKGNAELSGDAGVLGGDTYLVNSGTGVKCFIFNASTHSIDAHDIKVYISVSGIAQ